MEENRSKPRDNRSLREKAISIVRKLQEAGHEAYFAGGCVRDDLLGISPKDFDIATSATPDMVQALFRKTIPIGVQFGVIQVRYGGEGFEVATFRTDGGYTDGRRPDSVTFSTAKADVERRDFSMNGLLFDPIENRLLDFVEGQKDLEQGLIRAIGHPVSRIREDRLRMLRAIRFASRFRFEIEKETMEAIQQFASSIVQVSKERVREELFRTFREGGGVQGLSLLSESKLLDGIFGTVWAELPEQRKNLIQISEHIPSESPMAFFMLILLGKTPDELEQFARAMTFSNQERKRLLQLEHGLETLKKLEKDDVAGIKRLVREECWGDLHPLLRGLQETGFLDTPLAVESLVERAEQWNREELWPPPLLNGQDLMKLGLPPGPQFKALLSALETMQLEGRILTREEAISWVSQKGKA